AHVSSMLDQGGTPARLVSASRFQVASGVTLRVTGSLPLIVASWNDIIVDGTIDASSYRAGAAGGGANPASCSGNAAAVGQDGNSGTGGGGGGGFFGHGAHGGRADIDHPPEPQGGAGGTAVASPTIVRGGCSGARSGNNTDTTGGRVTGSSPGGAGGGA